MKNTIYTLIVLIFALTSCTKKDPFQEIAVKTIQSSFKNPTSFKLDSVKVDTMKMSDKLSSEFLQVYDTFKTEGDKYERMLPFVYIYSYDDKRAQLNKVEEISKRMKVLNQRIEKLKNTPQDTVVGYCYNLWCRGTNSFGAEVQDVCSVVFRKNNPKPTFAGSANEITERNLFPDEK